MRILLVHNPSAGSSPDVRPLIRALEDAGHQVRRIAREELTEALNESVDVVAAAGGDGTVRAVALAVAGTGVPFAMLPLGTANNIAKSVGVVGHARDVIAGWASGRRRPFDLGSVEAPRGSTRFVESFGGGLFADLLARAEGIGSSALHLGRETDSALYLLEQLAAQAEAKAWRVSVDGIDHGGRYLAVEVMNVQFIGANVPLAPHADVGDGELDVVLLGEKDREALRTYLHDRLELASGTLPAGFAPC